MNPNRRGYPYSSSPGAWEDPEAKYSRHNTWQPGLQPQYWNDNPTYYDGGQLFHAGQYSNFNAQRQGERHYQFHSFNHQQQAWRRYQYQSIPHPCHSSFPAKKTIQEKIGGNKNKNGPNWNQEKYSPINQSSEYGKGKGSTPLSKGANTTISSTCASTYPKQNSDILNNNYQHSSGAHKNDGGAVTGEGTLAGVTSTCGRTTLETSIVHSPDLSSPMHVASSSDEDVIYVRSSPPRVNTTKGPVAVKSEYSYAV